MSEKELRKLAKDILRDAYIGPHYANLVRQALAEPPDVAEILRRAKEGSDNAINDLEKFLYDCEIRWIEQQFHIRLTETGWEWTDDTS